MARVYEKNNSSPRYDFGFLIEAVRKNIARQKSTNFNFDFDEECTVPS
jgi:hypothetical protein